MISCVPVSKTLGFLQVLVRLYLKLHENKFHIRTFDAETFELEYRIASVAYSIIRVLLKFFRKEDASDAAVEEFEYTVHQYSHCPQ